MEYPFCQKNMVADRAAHIVMAKRPGKNQAGMAARSAASEVVWRVLIDGSYLDDAFVKTVADYKLDHRDRGLVRAISATTLRRLGQIRNGLARHMKKPLAPKFAHASCILYTASAQILFMDVPDHAVIDLAVAQLRAQRKLHHLSGMANAVLRKVAASKQPLTSDGDGDGDGDAGRQNTPKWLWQLWAKDYGKETAAKIANAHLREAPLDITLKSADHKLDGLELPTGSVRLDAGFGRLEDLAGFEQGDWWVQDFA
ncbi:MAG TPA: hypothetical protein ENJ55_07350, partial [Rhizobiales bacterium]|nr:hypothetical protein [Hyphomicrobiales bacterium]